MLLHMSVRDAERGSRKGFHSDENADRTLRPGPVSAFIMDLET